MQQSKQSGEQLPIEKLRGAGVDTEIVDRLERGDDDLINALASLDSLEELLEIARGPWHENGHYALRREPSDPTFAVSSQRLDTGYGKVYVNIRIDDEGRPFGLEAFTGSSGGFTNSFVEGLSGVISVALQSGVNPHDIVDVLQGIRAPKVQWDNSEEIPSLPAAIGIALRRYLNGTEGEGRSTKFDGTRCPECESPDVYVTDGMKHCQTCGWEGNREAAE